MRVTIIADDSHVYVEGHALTVDLAGLDDEIHAVQWYGTVGDVEYKHDHIENTKRQNERITDFAPYQVFVDRWMVEAQKGDIPTAAPVASDAEPMSVLT